MNDNVKIALQVGMFGVGILVVKKVLETFNIINTPEENAAALITSQTQSAASQSAAAAQNEITQYSLLPNNPALAWQPNYWQKLLIDNGKAYKLGKTKSKDSALQYKFTTAQYRQFAKDIAESNGGYFMPDDDNKVITTIRNLETQIQLSLLSYFFNLYYKGDLLNYISGFMEPENKLQLFEITNKLPKYYLFK